MEEIKKEIQEIEELIDDGNPLFEGKGISRIKVTKDGKIIPIVLKIKSTGVAELIDTFSKKAPTPPESRELIDPKSDLGREMGLSSKKWVRMPNFADPGYIEKKQNHDRELGMAVMLQGLDIAFKDKDGNPVTDSEEKVAILKRKGLTGDQFAKIASDIQDLTAWKEDEEADFFGMSSEED